MGVVSRQTNYAHCEGHGVDQNFALCSQSTASNTQQKLKSKRRRHGGFALINLISTGSDLHGKLTSLHLLHQAAHNTQLHRESEP